MLIYLLWRVPEFSRLVIFIYFLTPAKTASNHSHHLPFKLRKIASLHLGKGSSPVSPVHPSHCWEHVEHPAIQDPTTHAWPSQWGMHLNLSTTSYKFEEEQWGTTNMIHSESLSILATKGNTTSSITSEDLNRLILTFLHLSLFLVVPGCTMPIVMSHLVFMCVCVLCIGFHVP